VGNINGQSIKQVGKGEYATKSDTKLMGAGGTYTFHFHADKPGTTILNLVYRRPWEKAAAPAQTFSATINVSD
jgi:predicted secreted protein